MQKYYFNSILFARATFTADTSLDFVVNLLLFLSPQLIEKQDLVKNFSLFFFFLIYISNLNREENIKRKKEVFLPLFKKRWIKIFLKSKNAAPPLYPFSPEREQQGPEGYKKNLHRGVTSLQRAPEAPQQLPSSLIPLSWNKTCEGGKGERKRLIISSGFRHAHVSTVLRVALGVPCSR